MPIQIEQTFPRCNRCGRMIHTESPRIEATSSEGRKAVFCTEICRDEFATLFGLESHGQWTSGRSPRPSGNRPS